MPLQASSSFRRHGQRDDRRRRLLTDDLSNGGGWPAYHPSPDDAPPPKSEHYGDAAFLERQPRLLDLMPHGLIALSLLAMAAAAILAGLEASYAWMLSRIAHGGAAVAALDLGAKDSLGCWFSSLMLLAAAVAACLIYTVRRHRIDDYQGRYRIWLWAAAWWFVMSTDQAASLREGFRDLMIALTGTPLVGDGTLWWAILYGLVLGAIGSRLLMDMRSSRLSMGVLLAAAFMHAVAIATRLNILSFPDGVNEVMLRAGAEMFGNLMLLAAMMLYCRHVVRDAQGLLPHAEPHSDDEATDEAIADETERPASTGHTWVKIDPPHAASQPTFQRTATPQAATSVALSSPASTISSPPINRKLTKGERKALKERLLRERLDRQQRG
jgi:hypothetical protein